MTLYLVNLDGVRLIKIDDEARVPEVHVELERSLVGCPTCGVVAVVKDRHPVTLVDLAMVGRTIVLVWNKRRFRCAEQGCPAGTWTEVDERIATPRSDDRSSGAVGNLRSGQEWPHRRRGCRAPGL